MKNTMSVERPSGRLVLEFFDGRAFVCSSLADAFRMLRADAWACADQSKQAYMQGVARRCLAWNKAQVRVDSVEHFIG